MKNEFSKIEEQDLEYFKLLVTEKNCLTTKDRLVEYDHDYTEDLHYLPHVVLIPETVEHISAIVKYCNSKNFPVTVRGAGTGLSGGALPVY